MKKSKLLIPAVGFLMISLAAAGTSTVAWFTSTTAATAEATNFVAGKVDGGLKIWATSKTIDGMTAVIGSDSAATSSVGIALGEKSRLRDASLDVSSKIIESYVPENYYTDEASETFGQPSSFKAFSYSNTTGTHYTDVTEDGNTIGIYTYAKFTLSFKSGNSVGTQAVYFDMKNSTLKNGESAINTPIRIAFASQRTTGSPCGTAPVVWAPNETTTTTLLASTGIKYVAAAGLVSTSATFGYYKNNVAYNAPTATADTTTPFTKYESENDTSLTYLGKLSATDGATLSIDFYVWFDGTDAGCVDDSLITSKAYSSALSGSLKFYSLTA